MLYTQLKLNTIFTFLFPVLVRTSMSIILVQTVINDLNHHFLKVFFSIGRNARDIT